MIPRHHHAATTGRADHATGSEQGRTPRQDAPSQADVLVVGGGINGVGIARDLAGRGLRVVLCERDDLAAHTSSSSTKLIHGGLRYLEHREFGLVRKALQERELLLRAAPHITAALRFVMPHAPHMRPAWLIRLGLFLYDHLARRAWLPASGGLDLRRHPAGAPLRADYARGFVYSDGWVDDARLVALCAVDAAERGACVLTHTACLRAERAADAWTAALQGEGGPPTQLRARALVNAAGPWAERFLKTALHEADGAAPRERGALRLVRGSHIVVPRLFDHGDAYILQADDRRIVFAIPYEHDFTLIGTTDVEVDDPAAGAHVSEAEIAYLCAQVNRYFRAAVEPAQVVWSYAGVRPLLEDHAGDPAAATRDYRLEFDVSGAPLLTVWGGKITTFRKLAEQAADRLCAALGEPRPAWTATATLPGGDLGAWIGPLRRPDEDFARFVEAVARRVPWLPGALAQRYARAYGSRIDQILRAADASQAGALRDLGEEVAPGLYEAELRYLQQVEWACCADDVLWRRSKLGLHLTPAQRAAVAAWFDRQQPKA